MQAVPFPRFVIHDSPSCHFHSLIGRILGLPFVMLRDMDNLGKAIPDPEYRPIPPIDPKRIKPDGFGLEFFGM